MAAAPSTNTTTQTKATASPVPSRVEATKKARRRRSDSFDGLDYRLHVPEDLKDPRYTYRWINDEPGKIFQATEQDDWDFVYDERIRTEGDGAQKNTGEGTRISRVVGRSKTGEPLRAYLCRKLQEYFDEDNRKRHRKWQELTAQVEQGYTPGAGGLFNSDPEHAYIPRDARREPRGL
jgi:hypothetical protein